MSKLLYIKSSPRGNRSASSTAAEHYIQSYQTKYPTTSIETLDLWKTSLPEFDGATIDAKYAVLHGQAPTPEQQQAWDKVVKIAEHFKSADEYLISLPMWNFGIPYKLKHYLDVLLQPGLTFSFTPSEGYRGLVTGKPVTVIYARGGAYGPGTGAESYDQQSGYMKQALGFIGFTDIQEIFVEPTLASATSKDEALVKANQKADELIKARS
ncbi:MAG: NAD(P)H-dependent oxidoreductase [Verrucomicrobiota bacterium]